MFWFITTTIITGVWIYNYINKNEDIQKVHDVFKNVYCKNTILPSIYIPKNILSWLETFKFVSEEILLRIDQFLRKTCIKTQNGLYLIQFYIDGKLYKLLIKPMRGPPLESIFYLPDNKDITTVIEPFIRSSYGIVDITPKHLNYDNILISKKNNKIVIESQDKIYMSYLL